MLDLTEYEPLPPPELTPPAERRSPAIALLLSMVFPGLGHLYLGLRQSAFWLIVCEAIALTVMTYGSGSYHAQSILVAPILYCFAMADAYYSAREWNAGATFLFIGANPRIAAILNLLTKGFGYFYLGDRMKGILCFFAVGAVQGVLLLRTNIWTSVLAITIQIVIAADGYRVARQRLIANHPDLERSADGGAGVIERANPNGLPPAVSSAFFLTLCTAVAIGYGALRVMDGRAITTMGSLEEGPTGLLYRNSVEHIELTAPDNWKYTRPGNTLVKLDGDGCSVIIVDEFSTYAAGSTIDANERDILKRHPEAAITSSELALPGHLAQSFEATFTSQSGLLIHQRFIVHRRGFKMLILIETWATPEQRKLLDGIEKTYRA